MSFQVGVYLHTDYVMSKMYIYMSLLYPGLDLLRLALLNDDGSSHFIGDVDNGKVFLGELLAFAV